MTRDLTERQFQAAMKRNGFRFGPLGLIDTTGQISEGCSYGFVFQPKPFRILRRETLARCIALRDRDLAKRRDAKGERRSAA